MGAADVVDDVLLAGQPRRLALPLEPPGRAQHISRVIVLTRRGAPLALWPLRVPEVSQPASWLHSPVSQSEASWPSNPETGARGNSFAFQAVEPPGLVVLNDASYCR